MAIYEANPVRVEAWKIYEVGDVRDDGSIICRIKGPPDLCCIATSEMLSRITPQPGDYWVTQADGYEYLNPKHVFERKYHLVEDVK